MYFQRSTSKPWKICFRHQPSLTTLLICVTSHVWYKGACLWRANLWRTNARWFDCLSTRSSASFMTVWWMTRIEHGSISWWPKSLKITSMKFLAWCLMTWNKAVKYVDVLFFWLFIILMSVRTIWMIWVTKACLFFHAAWDYKFWCF